MKNILVTGGSGLVGCAIRDVQDLYPNYKFVFVNSKDADLSSFDSTNALFERIKPEFVIHLAACVGGLFKNMNNKVEMLEKNLMINYNVVHCCYKNKVEKLIACLSTCIFPDKTTYPINESMLHNGPPHDSNDAYAYAKRMLEIHCKAYRENYGVDYQCVIPTNIYGPNDNYHLEDAHVIPALIHKCYLAKEKNEPFIMRGTGKPLRQFIYSRDLAKFILWILNNEISNESLILAPNPEDEISIEQVAKRIAKEFNYQDRLKYDNTRSDGQYRKTADNKCLRQLYGDLDLTSIESGIKETVHWFQNNFQNCRK